MSSSPEKHFANLARLSQAAERGAPDRDLSPALATRVLAELRAVDRASTGPSWEGWSLRAVPLAVLAAAGCFLFLSRAPADLDERRLTQHIVQEQLSP